MSTSTVLAETLALAEREGLRAVCLPSWYDVDHHEDLVRLSTELDSLPDHVAAHTRAFLSQGQAYLAAGCKRLMFGTPKTGKRGENAVRAS
jgi:hypothetical protein